MLRFTLAALALTVAPAASALTTITCKEAPFSLELQVDFLKSEPPQTAWQLSKDGALVGSGSVFKSFEGRDSFLRAWLWTFESDGFVLGVGVVGTERPGPGLHAAKADLFVKAGDELFEGSTVDCLVNID